MACEEKIDRLEQKCLRYERIIADLEEMRERYELAINGTSEGLWDWDLITNEIYFSPRWKEMVGYRDDELPNALETWIGLVHPDDLEQANQAIEASLQDSKIPYENVHRLRHKKGHYIWNLDRGQVIVNEAQQPVRMIGFHTDITRQQQMIEEIKTTQELMMAQSRHAAMGEMISMIAHQWRQPLSIVSMIVNNLLVDIELDGLDENKCTTSSKEILSQVNFLSKTIDVFRDFFRPSKEKELADIVEMIHEALAIIDASLKNKGISIEISNPSDVRAKVYSRELLQVVINIIKNAKEALVMSNVSDPSIKIEIKEEGEMVDIAISNNGPSITTEVISHIFEPYFSTKDEKIGTGLGLYMSKIIVEKHLHGVISVHNMDGGVCFNITLPKQSECGAE
ncbi:PAS domain-containing sensor histidine kinase [Sulfuricurvum sp.]|uniref:sensor histidine kinase n=1 Tax=Sulfuricurvum sp. TaxID=2025608 RepID=UPI0026116826|nr:PAS domain-containing sensor histidine kinase [Sulfuricurvum sp.]MDD2780732.1 PAS domain-containing sensor histidine kinase [Sulfuricurvum sp.]